jgi:hypothetical protein
MQMNMSSEAPASPAFCSKLLWPSPTCEAAANASWKRHACTLEAAKESLET